MDNEETLDMMEDKIRQFWEWYFGYTPDKHPCFEGLNVYEEDWLPGFFEALESIPMEERW